MWLFTKHGFYSVVSCKTPSGFTDHKNVCVRARVKSHLESLIEACPDLKGSTIISTEDRDYACRIIVDKDTWADIAFLLTSRINYTNFKDEVAEYTLDAAYEAKLHEVWEVMYQLQEGQRRIDA